jgi:hypothetical protein
MRRASIVVNLTLVHTFATHNAFRFIIEVILPANGSDYASQCF